MCIYKETLDKIPTETLISHLEERFPLGVVIGFVSYEYSRGEREPREHFHASGLPSITEILSSNLAEMVSNSLEPFNEDADDLDSGYED